ncbi:MAG: hypothetical protein JWM70_961, partial [Microbacteriaceae bacterium]|nr:hypothetical protein [Microbacteriaceae bacterium]
VVVTWSCTDALSGVATGPADDTVTGEGGNLSSSATCTDKAGNTASKTVTGIQIDRTAPTTTASIPNAVGGWYKGAVEITLSGDDALSGIGATHYRIDGGDIQSYGGPFSTELATGVHSLTFWSTDVAGNVETQQTTAVRLDNNPPTIAGAATPGANGFGWNNTNVDVAFTCGDTESGVAGCGPNTTVGTEGANQQAHGDTQDVVGNVNSTTVDHINIDKTAPTLVGTATTHANGAGWYNGDVTIAWTGSDALSGIDPSTQPSDGTITGQGNNLGASASISDKAGNQKTATVNGINIDRTAPAIDGGPTTAPNAAGWYRDQVVVDFTCTDSLSGLAFCPTSKVIAGSGSNQAVTSEPAVDKAGNQSATKTVGGINIDGSAPSTTANNQCTLSNGWCTGGSANVVLTATDQPGLSGVKELHYRIDGGAEQVAAGATKTVAVPLSSGSGAGTVAYWAVDNAGNTEASNAVALKWDNIAPTVTHTLSPVPNANDWNKSDVTVTFSAKDDDAGSGGADVTETVTVSTETDGQVVLGSAKDTAGNVGNDKVTVKLDKTAPTISGAVVSGTQVINGWYTGAVTVHFTCADARSGVAACPDNVILTNNGANSASGTVTDNAGNPAVTTLSGISIDKEAPSITGVNVDGGLFTLGAVPAPTCTASDSLSGLSSCVVTTSGGTANGVGTFSYTAKATDKVGNTGTTTGTYRVIYRFDGFLQPINDTAHQVGTSTSIFKGGSTIPVKFQLMRANGTVVAANTAPVWLTPAKGAPMSLPVGESLYSAAADSGSTYRYDTSQYLYNWKTTTSGNY